MSVLTLAEAKTHLNLTGSTHDTELQDAIDSAESVIAKRVGPLASTATAVRVRGMCSALVLPVLPAISLTSVTGAGGAALTLADLYLDTASGLVTYDDGSAFSERYYDVVYAAGRGTCPDDLLLAVKELVRWLWQPQRGPKARGTADQETPTGLGYLLPYRVEQLIQPHIQPGFG